MAPCVQDIGFVVMPPGTGKSYLHLRMSGLVEGDTIVPNKKTEELKRRRKEAKETGDWEGYDKEWGREIMKELGQGRWVVLVPSYQVGRRNGWVELGGVVLDHEMWKLNFKDRKDTHHRHQACYKEADEEGATKVKSNAHTQELVTGWAAGWLG